MIPENVGIRARRGGRNKFSYSIKAMFLSNNYL